MRFEERRVSGRSALLQVLLASAIAVPVVAVSTGAFADLSQSGVETVVVTAQKRPEQLKNVPESISVLDSHYLEQIGADSLESFANTVPGLEMQTFAPGRTRITIRGISPTSRPALPRSAITSTRFRSRRPISAASPKSGSTTSIMSKSCAGRRARCGEGAMGGLVHIITNKPNTTDYQASILSDVYSIQGGGVGYKVDAMANIPVISDMLAVRVVLEDRYNAGWITDNIYSIPNAAAAPPGRYHLSSVEKNSTIRATNWCAAPSASRRRTSSPSTRPISPPISRCTTPISATSTTTPMSISGCVRART